MTKVSSDGSDSIQIQGVLAAAPTPRRASGHEIDVAAALEVIDFLGEHPLRGICLMGSTGEFIHFDFEERVRFINLAIKRSRLPVMVNVTHTTVDGTLALGAAALDAGAEALLVMPPPYFRYMAAEVEEFYRHFRREFGGGKVFLYNVPFFTSPLDADVAARLLESGEFAGIKDSGGRMADFCTLRDVRGRVPFSLLVGNDGVFAEARREGADGVVSGCAGAVPELLLGLDAALARNDDNRARLLNHRLREFIDWITEFPVPIGIKTAAAVRGLKTDHLASPLGEERRRRLDEFREWFRAWLPSTIEEARG
jgi:dihydrodipicolinate synthase/N-acetylneuraminate lyase